MMEWLRRLVCKDCPPTGQSPTPKQTPTQVDPELNAIIERSQAITSLAQRAKLRLQNELDALEGRRR